MNMRPKDLRGIINFRSEAKTYWVFYLIAAFSFLPALGFYFVGEEAIFPISSLEMWYRGEMVRQILYGSDLLHNPLYNWLIILFSTAVGWENMLVVARSITVFAVVLTGVITGWLAGKLFRDNGIGAFTGLIFLTLEDVFFYRGWLAYVDPLFGLLVFTSIACLWVAILEKRISLLWLGSLALAGAFLTKAITAYVFYFLALAVLAFRKENREFILRPSSLLPHLLALSFPAFWFSFVTGHVQQSRMIGEILNKFSFDNWVGYGKQLLAFPFLTFVHLLPWSLVVLYVARGKRFDHSESGLRQLTTAAWIVGLNYIPYWLSPNSHPRYVLPLYPLFALILAYLMWGLGEKAKTIAMRVFGALFALKLIFVMAAFPYYQSHYRGENYQMAARDILRRTGEHKLYSSYTGSSGLSVTAYLDILRLPQKPLTFPPAQWESGFVLAHTPDSSLGQVVAHYQFVGDNIYMLCRGRACGAHGERHGFTGEDVGLH